MWNNVFFLWICISGCYKTIENTVGSWAELDLTLQPAGTKWNYINIRCTLFFSQPCCFEGLIFLQSHNITHMSFTAYLYSAWGPDCTERFGRITRNKGPQGSHPHMQMRGPRPERLVMRCSAFTL